MKIFVSIFILLITSFVYAQNFVDKEFYLIDSLDIDDLSSSELVSLNECLKIYHNSEVDTVKYNALCVFIDMSNDNDIAYLYNNYLCKQLTHKIELNESIYLKELLANRVWKILKRFRDQIEDKEYIQLLSENLNIYRDLKNDKEIATCYYHMGIANSIIHKGEAKSAINYFKESLSLYEKINNKEEIAKCLNAIAMEYRHLGDIEKSLSLYYKAVSILEEIGLKEGMAACYNNIALIQQSQGDYKEALSLYGKVLEIYKELNFKRERGIVLNNIAQVYTLLGDENSSLEQYTKSLKIFKELDDRQGIMLLSFNMGRLYFKRNDNQKASAYIKESMHLAEESQDIYYLSMGFLAMGELYDKMGDIQKAKEYLLLGYKLAKEMNNPIPIQMASECLSQIYIKENKAKEAVNMYKLSIKMRDSLKNEETLKATAKQQAKYTYEKQKLEDDLEHAKRLAVEQKAKEKQKIITLAITAGLVLVMVFLAVIFNRLLITRKQKLMIADQKKIIEESHREITDSITYAKRLQDAILPSIKDLKINLLKDVFIYYNPKDIVSGDFYWANTIGEISYLAVADCTGHGVPGAMVSIVCSKALDQATKEFGITQPSKILDKTRDLVTDTFAKSGNNVQDGMDISLCSINDNKLIFSGANNALWIVRDTNKLTEKDISQRGTIVGDKVSLIELKPDKQPVGLYAKMKPFTEVTIDLYSGDTLYFFTDGYVDQFGGEKGKKFKSKALKERLLSINSFSVENQKEELERSFKFWKGNYEQVDDVTIMGIRIS